MDNSRGSVAGEHVGEQLSGYLDSELTQQERQRVDLHLADCQHCAGMLRDLEDLRERMGQSGLSRKYEDEWREGMDDLGVKLFRGIGWVLSIGAAVIIGGFIVLQFLTDPGITGTWKFIIGAFYVGLLGLFISVLRQRLLERKTDRYKDVEI